MRRIIKSLAALLVCASAQLPAVAAQEIDLPEGCHEPSSFMNVQGRMRAELEAAYESAGRDAARAAPALDRIVARFQPCWDSFAGLQERRFEESVAAAPPGERPAMRERAAPFLARLRSGPTEARQDLERNGTLASPPPGPATSRPQVQ